MSNIQFNTIPVFFNPKDHTYLNTETGAYLQGITSTLIHRLNPDKYKGIPEDVLRQAAERGSKIHEELELIETIGIDPITQEGRNYLALKEQHGLEFLRGEHTVSDMEHYATNIDAIFKEPGRKKNVVDIVDYKTTSKFDRDSVSWQLSISAFFLELNNPHITVKRLFGIWLRGDIAQLIEVPRRTNEEVLALIQADQEDAHYEWAPELPDYIRDAEDELYTLGRQIKELTERYDTLKADVLKKMVECNDKTIDTGRLLLTVVAPTTRETFDSKKFKAEHEDLYSSYIKTSTTKETLKLTLR